MGFRDRKPGAWFGEKPAVKPSMQPSSAANDDLFNRTIDLRQLRLRRGLSREDFRQVVANVFGSFTILAEWLRPELSSQADDASTPDAPDTGEARHEH